MGEEFREEDRFETTQMPQLTVTAKRKYIAGYDSNGNPIYTDNPRESMSDTRAAGLTNSVSSDDMKFNLEQSQASANYRNNKAASRITQSMNQRIHPFFYKVLPLAATPMAAAAGTTSGVLANTFSALRTAAPHMAVGTLGGEIVDKGMKNTFGYTWGEGINQLSRGYIPTWMGNFTNPGYFASGLAKPLNNAITTGKNVASNVSRFTNHFTPAMQMAKNVASKNPNPYNWRNYKFLGDYRFYRDLDNFGIDNLLKAREGQYYPLTFGERRKYISRVKRDIQTGIDYAKQEAVRNLQTPLKDVDRVIPSANNDVSIVESIPQSPSDLVMQRPHFGTVTSINNFVTYANDPTRRVYDRIYTPWGANYAAYQNNRGLFFPFRTETGTLSTNPSLRNFRERLALAAHESRHTIQRQFRTPLTTFKSITPGAYNRYTNSSLPTNFKKSINGFINDAGTVGQWAGSLSEMDAELTGWSAKYGLPRYSEMTPIQKARIHNLFQRRFGGNSDYENYGEISSLLRQNPPQEISEQYAKSLDNSKIGQILLGLEELGYRKQGGKLQENR